jgi:hypothetical protein
MPLTAASMLLLAEFVTIDRARPRTELRETTAEREVALLNQDMRY